MALASSVNDYVMVRNVSCLFYNDKIYFKTDKDFRKTKQLYENPNVALCYGGIQVEGTAKNCGLRTERAGRDRHGVRRCGKGFGREQGGQCAAA